MQYVIIGSSAAGINAIEAIRSKDKKADITVISDEKKPLYSRCLISYLLAGTIDEKKIWYRPDAFFKNNKVDAILGVKAEKIDPDKKEIALGNKKKIKFDRLLVATGSSPKLEKIPGVDKKGVYPLRTMEHAVEIQSMLAKVKKVAVLGGGLIGLRAAYALKNRGKEVSVFVRSPQILSQIIDKGSADIMQRHIEKKGINIITGRSAKEIKGSTSLSSVVLDNDSQYDCELVIIGKGVNANIDMVKDAGMKTNWGVVVDEFLRTSNKNIFAAGDVAESHDIALEEKSINAIWPVACEQGRLAAFNMLGENKIYDGTLAMNSLEFFGLPVISIGITRPKKEGYEELIKINPERNVYKKIVLRDNVIVGAIALNSVDTIGIIGALIKNKVDITSVKDIILEDYFDYGKIVNLIKDVKQGFKEKEFRETIMTL
ncbi:MAG: FAD-dependent oxidoreductase [Candidatus Omnitrophica bacterium]|nr:FAD-dependent oxidoreductase [Candidatus Omnitrophota bacterium]MBU1853329.1 FAD-dependent oxidoreductase [Candidatus Omnitrophota bacterium]